jgi:penicillin-binding protein 1A
MPRLRRLLRLAHLLMLLIGLLGVGTLGVLYWMIAPTLPDVQALRDVKLQVPLAVHTRDGELIAMFGETRRIPVHVDDVPDQVKQAFMAIEDARFYEHPGVDWRGVARAVWMLAFSGRDRVPGGSTITQQVARNFFLSPEYSYTRKFTEMLLALKMERELSKDEIFGLYLNKTFFGHRAYGIAAAAEYYYGKTLGELELAEAAMLAGIPKFPSSGNPITNPDRARQRRDYILLRMAEVGFIGEAEARAAQAQPDRAFPHEPTVQVEAQYVAEMARQAATDRFGADAMIEGHSIYTTLDGVSQTAANSAVRSALLDYDRRHGWRGPEARVELAADTSPEAAQRHLDDHRSIAGLTPAIVVHSNETEATLQMADGQSAVLPLEGLAWARAYQDENSRGPAPKRADEVLVGGDIVRLRRGEEGEWMLAQIPVAQGALVAMNAEDGAIEALAGGFSFALNKFNRATQALRQPGSSFKPFVYAAAFERGFTPGSIVLDAPVVFHNTGSGESWRPQNDNATFAGPMRLREAMVTSRNLVSVRVLDAIGVGYATRYIQGFGFPPESLPENLSMALGTSSIPPLSLTRGYAVFANGGFLVEPYFIDRIVDREGTVIVKAHPLRACADCSERFRAEAAGAGTGSEFNLGATPRRAEDSMGPPDVFLARRSVDERTTYLIQSLLRDVVRRGTGRGALQLGRGDLGGKTGSTNDYRDAWFAGFGGHLAVSAWVGMDDFGSLGRGEFGARAALPMWVEFMRVALDEEPEKGFDMPNGIATALIDPDTGQLVPAGSPGALPELFKVEDIGRLEGRSAEQERALRNQESFDIF